MFNKVHRFFSDVNFEMGKVSWPNWDELKGSTYVVLTLSLVLIVFLFLIDLFLSKILEYIL